MPKPPGDSTPKDVYNALVTSHPLVRGAKLAADGVDWATATGKDLYRRAAKALTPATTPKPAGRRTKDIYLPPPSRGRSMRKR
jgi:hypothetical protein